MHLYDQSMNDKLIVCENLRSAYNVGTMLRTADALGRGVLLSWYSAPISHKKVKKTALGAEDSVWSKHILHINDTIVWLKEQWYTVIVAEITDNSTPLDQITLAWLENDKIAVIVWNEVTWVEQSTIDQAHHVVHIPMLGLKESLNVWQSAAMFMWHLKD